MSSVSTYLNFSRNTEEAFLFYQSVFGGEFGRGGLVRFCDLPPVVGMPSIQEVDLQLVMHVELPILGGHLLMGTDAPESMGFHVNNGNNVHINLEPYQSNIYHRRGDCPRKSGNCLGTVDQPLTYCKME